jgi:hypothetical protein
MANDHPTYRYVSHIPDLIGPEDYQRAHERKTVRIRVTVTDNGVEILADSPYPKALDRLLEQLNVAEIERMLCG